MQDDTAQHDSTHLPLTWWQRLFLPASLTITESSLPLALPATAHEFVFGVETWAQDNLDSLIDGDDDHADVIAKAVPMLDDKSIAELAVQLWRLRKRMEMQFPEARGKERRRFEDPIRRLEQVLIDAGVILDDPIGRPFVDGWEEVEVIANEPAGADTPDRPREGPWVADTIRPIVRKAGQIISRGQVIVANP
jgi:hypothetical protein